MASSGREGFQKTPLSVAIVEEAQRPDEAQEAMAKHQRAISLLSSVGLLAMAVLTFSAVTEARPNRGVLSLPDDAWTATHKALSKGKDVVVSVKDTVKDGMGEVSGAWVIGVTCAVSSLREQPTARSRPLQHSFMHPLRGDDSATLPLLQVFASFMNTFAINLQKYSHLQNERLPEHQRKPYYRDFLWAAGAAFAPSVAAVRR